MAVLRIFKQVQYCTFKWSNKSKKIGKGLHHQFPPMHTHILFQVFHCLGITPFFFANDSLFSFLAATSVVHRNCWPGFCHNIIPSISSFYQFSAASSFVSFHLLYTFPQHYCYAWQCIVKCKADCIWLKNFSPVRNCPLLINSWCPSAGI